MDFPSDDVIEEILSGIVMLVAAVMFVVAMRHRKRLSRWAAKNGFQYSGPELIPTAGLTQWKPKRDGRYDDVWFRQYAELSPFDNKNTQTVKELLVKVEDGAVWRVFRFSVANRAGEQTRRAYWVCTVELEMDFPALDIRPVGLKDKVARLFVRRNIETGSGEFDDRFQVGGDDAAFARDFLDSGMKRLLLKEFSYHWQMRGPHVMLVRPHSHKVKDVEMMLFAMRRFLAAMPEGVVEKYVAP